MTQSPLTSIARLTAVSALFAAGVLHASDAAIDANRSAAQAVIKQFSTQLKGELSAAMTEGGPVAAIDVCKERAPAIAAALSAETGWDLRRTSLKVRNQALNAPDAWEQQVLTEFVQRQAEGVDVQTLAKAEIVESDGVQRFRFMKAIPTGEGCLTCHGTEIVPDVAAALDAQYPDDQARSIKLGEIRGAFSLSKPL